MAILGLGTDIVEISRIQAVVERTGERLARRILSPSEWQHYQQHQQPVRFLAKRFAVKEAAAKAFGTGIRNGLAFNQFEVVNDALETDTAFAFAGRGVGCRIRGEIAACHSG